MSVDDDEPKKPNFPGVWGAGYQAGYADCLAGKPNGRTIMNRKKIERMKRGMTAMAMKVYNCVPMNESWDKSKIHAEMHRQGMTHNAKVIDGCLNNLRGVGVSEAPRGTLFHHYRVDKDDRVTMCNLIVSTTNNNEPMNQAVTKVAKDHFTGRKEITEALLNHVEVAIRAYDPCLSCATHAYGKMPMIVELVSSDGTTRERMVRGSG